MNDMIMITSSSSSSSSSSCLVLFLTWQDDVASYAQAPFVAVVFIIAHHIVCMVMIHLCVIISLIDKTLLKFLTTVFFFLQSLSAKLFCQLAETALSNE
ncbi:hypothetical protein KFK09_009258 [Dendrobium nobile]|uniref:Uncharacterized protein n=1 Tax=Dendrobium nobile TaxID=94219 RepID=A0A8T3BMV9_DENNO|nr:hypothetical protein KFK09_009258 [Dendrobium nobile]